MTIVAQTDTAESSLAKERKKEATKATKKKTEERDVVETLTAGTLRDLDLIGGDARARYLLCLAENMSEVPTQSRSGEFRRDEVEVSNELS